MKIVARAGLLLSMIAVGRAAETDPKAESPSELPKPESFAQRASYAIGLNYGKNMSAQGVEIDLDYLIRGLTDGIKNNTPLMTQAEIEATGQEFQREFAAMRQRAAEAAKKAGQDFLAANGKREGVTTTASGLQYEVLKKGKGAKPDLNATVKVHYRGTFLDGKEFDSSYRRDAPATFGLTQVISGWTEALQLMQPGAKYKLYIPSNLAYGSNGKAPDIPPDSTLIFEVELLEIL